MNELTAGQKEKRKKKTKKQKLSKTETELNIRRDFHLRPHGFLEMTSINWEGTNAKCEGWFFFSLFLQVSQLSERWKRPYSRQRNAESEHQRLTAEVGTFPLTFPPSFLLKSVKGRLVRQTAGQLVSFNSILHKIRFCFLFFFKDAISQTFVGTFGTFKHGLSDFPRRLTHQRFTRKSSSSSSFTADKPAVTLFPLWGNAGFPVHPLTRSIPGRRDRSLLCLSTCHTRLLIDYRCFPASEEVLQSGGKFSTFAPHVLGSGFRRALL